ncbi:LysR family transcriptional regulator [Pseudovibrio axinellae]|nr:LysR family transcriptional regulator [Pseudovibrio axinellae]
MKTFILVAQSGSFADTAKKLNVATSVVSKRIKDLEAYLGVSLLQRTTRKVRLSDAGYGYLKDVSQVLENLDEAEAAIRYSNQTPTGEIKLAAPLSFGTKYLGPVIARYLQKHQQVEVSTYLSDRKVDLVEEGYDLAIRIGHLSDSALIAKKILTCRRVVCASPAYLSKYGRPLTPSDLSQHNCMKYDERTEGKTWRFQVDGTKFMQPAPGRFSSDNGDLLCEAAVAGCGITYLPTFIVGKEIEAGRLEVVLDEFEEQDFSIYIIYQDKRHLSFKVRSLIDTITDAFRDGL